MKKSFYAIIALMMLAACSQTDKQLIEQAEALLYEHPDSALIVLIPSGRDVDFRNVTESVPLRGN